MAAELERSADRAQRRGGIAAAAAFLQRSVELTRESSRRVERALAAAQVSLYAGEFDAALRMLATAEDGALVELQRVRVELMRAQITFVSGAASDAPRLLLKVAERLEPLDVGLSRETYLDAWGAAYRAGRFANGADLIDVSRAARAAPSQRILRNPPICCSTASRCSSWKDASRRHRFSGTRRALFAVQRSGGKRAPMELVSRNGSGRNLGLRGLEGRRQRQVELARDTGALAFLPLALNAHAMALTLCGDFEAAASVNAEFDAVTDATRSRVPPYGAILLAALRGTEPEAHTLIGALIKNAAAEGEGLAEQYAHLTAAVLYNGLGRYQEALDEARQASNVTPELHLSIWALPEEIEAAARSGETRHASDALERLATFTNGTDADFGLGIEARSRALLSHGDTAEHHYHEAIDRLNRTQLRPEFARAHLLYGEWLRREGRRVAAREPLRTAHQLFGEIGMEGFAERARRELLATGESVRKRSVETRDDLTAQEQQIAQLASDGLSNPEIGARLFLSPRTVEWHLRKVFMKLDISSRRGIKDVLPRGTGESPPA